MVISMLKMDTCADQHYSNLYKGGNKNMDTTTLVSLIGTIINPVVVVVLLAIGVCIKHVPTLEKVSNNLIPIILIVVGMLADVATKSPDVTYAVAVMNGVVDAALAITIHQSGKNVFSMFTGTVVDNTSEAESKDEAAE